MRFLDLFCCEGVGAWGYWMSGRFSEIVGVDINGDHKAHNSFDFIQADALSLTYDFLDQFDFIHASPPCQSYSNIGYDRERNIRLVAATKLMLAACGKPHVIENVQGAMKELRPNISMDGHSVGLPIERRRYFYVSDVPGTHQILVPGESLTIHGSKYVNRQLLIKAFGLEQFMSSAAIAKLTVRGIEESIPPAMTYRIAQLTGRKKYRVPFLS